MEGVQKHGWEEKRDSVLEEGCSGENTQNAVAPTPVTGGGESERWRLGDGSHGRGNRCRRGLLLTILTTRRSMR